MSHATPTRASCTILLNDPARVTTHSRIVTALVNLSCDRAVQHTRATRTRCATRVPYDDFCSGVNNVSTPDARHHDDPVFVRDGRLCVARCTECEFECDAERDAERFSERVAECDGEREEGGRAQAGE